MFSLGKIVLPALFLAMASGSAVAAPAERAAKSGAAKQKTEAQASKSGKKTSAKGGAKSSQAHKTSVDAKKSKKGATAKKAGKVVSLAGVEQDVLALPDAERKQAFSMMMTLALMQAPNKTSGTASLAPKTVDVSGAEALERLETLVKSSGAPEAARCIGQFAAVEKDPNRRLDMVFPNGCAGLREIHGPAVANSKVEALAQQWASLALKEGKK